MGDFDPDTYGKIVIPPPKLFPAKVDPACPIPEAALLDPLGCGQAALDFLDNFEMVEGRRAGRSVSEAMAPWQRADIIAVHGHRCTESWTRYINWSPAVVARKNAKTFRLAVHALLLIASGQEPSASIVAVAGSQPQARRTWELLMGIIKTNSRFMSQLRVQDHVSILTNLETNATFRAVPAVPDKLYGLSPSAILGDEMHIWAGDKGQKLWSSLFTGMGARLNPIVLTASTVPDSPPAPKDIFAEQLKRAMGVIDGSIDEPRALPYVWITNEDDDIHSEETWKKVNPNLGYSLAIDEIRESYETAKHSEAGLEQFAAMRLNRIPRGSLEDSWMPPHVVDAMVQDFTDEELMDCPLRVMGLDIGGGYDLESIALVGIEDGGRMLVKQWSFISNDGLERLRAAGEPVDEFLRKGELSVAGNSAVPIELVASEIADIADHFSVERVICDMTMTAIAAAALESTGLEILAGRQGTISMSPVMFWAENLANDKNIYIGQDSLMKWAIHNTGQFSNSSGRRPIKRGRDDTSNSKKMDPVAAWLTGLQLALDQEANAGKFEENVERVNPWEDVIDALAVKEGYKPMFTCGLDLPREGNAYILRGAP
jgi:phage terminase large subunit-like protein